MLSGKFSSGPARNVLRAAEKNSPFVSFSLLPCLLFFGGFFFSFFFFKPKPVTPHFLLTLLTSCYFYLRWLTFTANGADLAVGVSVAAAYGSRDGSFSCQRRHISLHSTASLPWHRMRNNFRCEPTHWCNTVEYFSSTIPTGCAALYQKLHTITVLQYTLRMYFYF